MSIISTSIFESFKKENNNTTIKTINKLKDTATGYSNQNLKANIESLEKKLDLHKKNKKLHLKKINGYEEKKESLIKKQKDKPISNIKKQKDKLISKKIEKYESRISFLKNNIKLLQDQIDTPIKLTGLRDIKSTINILLTLNDRENPKKFDETLKDYIKRKEEREQQLETKSHNLITQKNNSYTTIDQLNNAIEKDPKNKEIKKQLKKEYKSIVEKNNLIYVINNSLYNNNNTEKLNTPSIKKENTILFQKICMNMRKRKDK